MFFFACRLGFSILTPRNSENEGDGDGDGRDGEGEGEGGVGGGWLDSNISPDAILMTGLLPLVVRRSIVGGLLMCCNGLLGTFLCKFFYDGWQGE